MRGMSKLASKYYTPSYMKLVWIPADKSPVEAEQIFYTIAFLQLHW